MQNHVWKWPVLAVLLIAFAGTISFADDAAPTTQPTTSPSAKIDWSDAKNHADETVTVTGPVIGAHAFDNGSIVLNVGKNYPDPARFTVFIGADGAAGLPDDHYEGKTISVTGKIEMFKDVPEIKCAAKDIQVTATTQP